MNEIANKDADTSVPSDALTSEQLKSLLREGVTDLTWIKKNGEQRRMQATLDPELIPEDKRPKGTKTPGEREVAGEIVRAFDTELGEFRTVTVNKVIAMFKTG